MKLDKDQRIQDLERELEKMDGKYLDALEREDLLLTALKTIAKELIFDDAFTTANGTVEEALKKNHELKAKR